MTIKEHEAALANEINSLGDCFNQYSYLISKSSELAPMIEIFRTDENLVSGCQSKVWLTLQSDDRGRITFLADSDTLIIKGLLALFCELINGRCASEIADAPFDFLDKTDLGLTFTSERITGITKIIERIRAEAEALYVTSI